VCGCACVCVRIPTQVVARAVSKMKVLYSDYNQISAVQLTYGNPRKEKKTT